MFGGEEGQVTPRTLSGRAYSHLHDVIVRGRLAPGERLRIEDLALSLKLSPRRFGGALSFVEHCRVFQTMSHTGELAYPAFVC